MKHIVSYRKFLFLSQSQDTQNYDSDLINNRINLLEETAKSRVFSLSGNLEFTPRSITVLTAAAFGGLIGFGFSQLNKIHQLGEAVEITARDLILLPSFLLTAIIATLIVTRITEARFPLTIQIMDFWGATALGVISALLGDAALRNLLSL